MRRKEESGAGDVLSVVQRNWIRFWKGQAERLDGFANELLSSENASQVLAKLEGEVSSQRSYLIDKYKHDPADGLTIQALAGVPDTLRDIENFYVQVAIYRAHEAGRAFAGMAQSAGHTDARVLAWLGIGGIHMLPVWMHWTMQEIPSGHPFFEAASADLLACVSAYGARGISLKSNKRLRELLRDSEATAFENLLRELPQATCEELPLTSDGEAALRELSDEMGQALMAALIGGKRVSSARNVLGPRLASAVEHFRTGDVPEAMVPHEGRRVVAPQRDAREGGGTLPLEEFQAHEAASAEGLAATEQVAALLAEADRLLTPPLRQVLRMYLVQEMTVKEMALARGTREATVSKQVSVICEKLAGTPIGEYLTRRRSG